MPILQYAGIGKEGSMMDSFAEGANTALKMRLATAKMKGEKDKAERERLELEMKKQKLASESLGKLDEVLAYSKTQDDVDRGIAPIKNTLNSVGMHTGFAKLPPVGTPEFQKLQRAAQEKVSGGTEVVTHYGPQGEEIQVVQPIKFPKPAMEGWSVNKPEDLSTKEQAIAEIKEQNKGMSTLDAELLYNKKIEAPGKVDEIRKSLMEERAKIIEDPASVKEFKFFQELSKKDKDIFLNLQRAGKLVDMGDRIGVLDPGDQTKIGATFTKNLAPKDQPENIAKGEEAKKIGELSTASNFEDFDMANKSVEGMAKINKLIHTIKTAGVDTGFGADLLRGLESLKVRLGGDAKKLTEYELMDVLMGSEVFPLIKQLGIGARGMDTPEERKFMRRVLTGELTLNKKTLLDMANLRKKASLSKIKKWNDRVNKNELDTFFRLSGRKKEILTVPPPPQPPAPKGATQGGVDPDTNEWVFYDANGKRLE